MPLCRISSNSNEIQTQRKRDFNKRANIYDGTMRDPRYNIFLAKIFLANIFSPNFESNSNALYSSINIIVKCGCYFYRARTIVHRDQRRVRNTRLCAFKVPWRGWIRILNFWCVSKVKSFMSKQKYWRLLILRYFSCISLRSERKIYGDWSRTG